MARSRPLPQPQAGRPVPPTGGSHVPACERKYGFPLGEKSDSSVAKVIFTLYECRNATGVSINATVVYINGCGVFTNTTAVSRFRREAASFFRLCGRLFIGRLETFRQHTDILQIRSWIQGTGGAGFRDESKAPPYRTWAAFHPHCMCNASIKRLTTSGLPVCLPTSSLILQVSL